MIFGKKKKSPGRDVVEAAISFAGQRVGPNVDDTDMAGFAERRALARRPTWRLCTVEAGEMYKVRGIILDHSSTGARFRTHGQGLLPEYVTLIAPELGIRRKCKVVWRDRGDTGLVFV